MSVRDIIIRIIAKAKMDEAKDASKAIQDLGDSGQAAATKLDATGKATAKAGADSATSAKSVSAAARALQTMGAGADGAAGKVGSLVAQMGNLGPAAAAAAAVVAGREIYRHIQEAIDKQREFVEGQQKLEEVNALRRLTEGYALLTSRIDEAASARNQLMAAEVDVERANLERDLARLRREKEEQKAELAPDDQIGRRKLDAEYNARIADAIDTQRAAETARQRQENLQLIAEAAEKFEEADRAFTALNTALIDKQQQVAQMVEDVNRREDMFQRMQQQSGQSVIGFGVESTRWLYNRSIRKAGAKAKKELPKLIDKDSDGKTIGEVPELQEKAAEALRNREAAARALTLHGMRAESLGMGEETDAERRRERSAREAQERAAIRKAERDAADRAADARVAAARKEMQEEFARKEREIRARRDPTQARVARERADVAEARSRLSARQGGSGETAARAWLEKQLKELEAAQAADARAQALVLQHLQKLTREKEAFEAQLKRIQ